MTIDKNHWRGDTFQKSTRIEGRHGRAEPAWRKSSFSGDNAQCVEIARPGLRFGVRDSKNTSGPVLDFDESQGLAFLIAVRRNRG